MRKMEKGAVIISGYLLKSPPESKLRNIRSVSEMFVSGNVFSVYLNESSLGAI